MTQFGRPTSDITNDFATGGFADLDEVSASDSDFANTADNTTGQLEVALTSSLADPEVSTGHVVRVRLAKADTGVPPSTTGNTQNMTVTLYQGATLIATVRSSAAVGAWAQTDYTLTAGEANSITDYTDLRVRIDSPASGGGAPGNRRGGAVSWVVLELPDAPAAPIPRSATDAATASDSPTRLFAGLRAVTDAITGSDVATRVGSFLRSATDTITASDAAVRVMDKTRTTSDAASTGDAAARVFAGLRSVADAAAHGDAAARVVAGVRSVTDAIAASDVAAQVKATARDAADAITGSDVASRIMAGVRSVADAITGSDAAERSVGGVRSVADAAGLSDVAVRLTAKVRSATDAATLSDVATQLIVSGGLERSATDAATASDAATRTVSLDRSATDAVSVSDGAVAVVTPGVSAPGPGIIDIYLYVSAVPTFDIILSYGKRTVIVAAVNKGYFPILRQLIEEEKREAVVVAQSLMSNLILQYGPVEGARTYFKMELERKGPFQKGAKYEDERLGATNPIASLPPEQLIIEAFRARTAKATKPKRKRR